MNVDYMFPTTLLYETLKLDRFQIRWSKLLARTMYQAIHKLCPPYLIIVVHVYSALEKQSIVQDLALIN